MDSQLRLPAWCASLPSTPPQPTSPARPSTLTVAWSCSENRNANAPLRKRPHVPGFETCPSHMGCFSSALSLAVCAAGRIPSPVSCASADAHTSASFLSSRALTYVNRTCSRCGAGGSPRLGHRSSGGPSLSSGFDVSGRLHALLEGPVLPPIAPPLVRAPLFLCPADIPL